MPSASSLSFTAAGQTQTFTVSEAGSSGAFTAMSSDGNVATVSTQDGLTFTVTAVGAGSATITVTDATNQSAPVSVTVTTTAFSVN